MSNDKKLTLTQTAKQLGIGKNTLLQKLRSAGWLHTTGNLRNAPTKSAIEQGLLHPKLTEFYRGPVRVEHATAHVTAKGLIWIQDLLEKNPQETADAS